MVVKTNPPASAEQTSKRVDYLDGLRGVAVAAVVLIHCGGGGFRALGPIGNSIVDHAKYGVQVFYVISAFSLCLAWRTKANLLGYWIRRVMRIVPMYFATLLIYLSFFHPSMSFASIFAHFTFANVFLPQYANDILSVEWSVAVEVGFYLIFPLLAILAIRWPSAFIGCATVAIVFDIAFRDRVAWLLGEAYFRYRNFSFPFHLYAFLAGMNAFVIAERRRFSGRARGYLLGCVAIVLLVSVLKGDGPQAALLVTLATALLVLASAGLPKAPVLGSNILRLTGKVSFSVYLLHILVISVVSQTILKQVGDFSLFVITLIATVCLSIVTFHVIERPAQRLGYWLERKWALVPGRTPDS